jgi:hypothetical protein
MTNYTTKGSYPYPDPTDAITDYPATASTFAGYVDNLPNRNVIINGNFDIWQRGTSFTTPTNGSYTADRWRLSYDGSGGTRSVTMNANVGAPLTGGIQQWRTLNLQQAIAGTGQTSLALSQRIENARTFAAETVTASAYIWGSTRTITVKLVQNFGTGGSPSSPVTTTLGTFAVSGVRNRMKLTATIPTAVSKTFGTNNDDYLELVFEVGGTGSSSFYFWGVQLEQNSTATALERRSLALELALCQRYFQLLPSNSAGGGDKAFSTGVAFQNNVIIGSITFPVMRTTALATVVSPTAFDVVLGNVVATGGTLTMSEMTASSGQIAVGHPSAAYTIGHGAVIRSDGGYVQLSAEL